MDSEVSCKLAWFKFSYARDELDSCVALLAELKVHSVSLTHLVVTFPFYQGLWWGFVAAGEDAISLQRRRNLTDF
jgi:hypothetical protein